MKKILTIKLDLYEMITQVIIRYFETTLEFNELEREKLYLGILSIVINFTKMSIICLIALAIGLLRETLIVVVIFSSLRLTAAGLHAKSSFACTITSILAFIGGAYMSKQLMINEICFMFIVSIIVILLYKYSPADTENRPILDKKRRKTLRNQTLITSLLWISINLIIKDAVFMNLTLYAMTFELVSILPITYKLLKRSYKNYERYEE